MGALLDIDPRGGFFDHAHVVGAIRQVCNDPALQAKALLAAGRVGQSMTELTDRMALKIRAMLSQLRSKRDGYVSSCARSSDYEPSRAQPAELRALYDKLESGVASPSTPSKKRLKPNPFIHFRDVEPNSAMSSDEDEEVVTVATYFDGTSAVRLYSDGASETATHYSKGGNGFAIAHFAEGPPWETEVLAAFVDEGANLKMQTPPIPKTGTKTENSCMLETASSSEAPCK